MDGTWGDLLPEGLRITAIGMTWVFAGLGLVWMLIFLLNHLFPHRVKGSAREIGLYGSRDVMSPVEPDHPDTVTAKRAEVAAIVAAALLSGALAVHPEAPVGPGFDHGRTAPSWVTANRARTLQPWQPPRHPGN
jgi:hypothetical protein